MMVSAACAIDEGPRLRAITDTYEYDGFGNSVSTSGNTPNEFLYRGEQYDSDLSLYYLRARYYNPLTGRFMSRDPEEHLPRDWTRMPLDPRSLHSYLYAQGDPANMIDPPGRLSVMQYAIIGAILTSADLIYSLHKEMNCVTSVYNGIAAALKYVNTQYHYLPSPSDIGQCGWNLVKDFFWPFPGIPGPFDW